MGSPLRILHVVVNMNRGGAETLIMNLYRNIDRSKVQFDFLTCKPGVFDSEIEAMGGRVYRIPYISEVGHLNYIKELDKFFQTNREYKIVHSHMDKMSGFVLRAAKRAGIPYRISHSHNTESEGGIAAKAYKWYAGKHILLNATDFFACSEEAAKWLFSKKAGTSSILKNGIEIEQFRFCPDVREEVRREFNLKDNMYVVGHVGRFAHQKNHTFLIDIFAEYSKLEKNTVLMLVGDGPLRKEIAIKVKQLNIENKVIFTGIRSDINRLLQAFDIFVFPSLHEGLPVSLIEAQGAGLPCIISSPISQGVDLGLDLIEYVSLTNKEEWVGKIAVQNQKSVSRVVNDRLISRKGYAIKNTANELENYYLSISR